MLSSEVLEIPVNLRRRGVDPRIVRLRLERVGVVVCLVITLASAAICQYIERDECQCTGASLPRISVIEPNATKIGVLLIDRQTEIAEGPL
jgi:hypothetical protein